MKPLTWQLTVLLLLGAPVGLTQDADGAKDQEQASAASEQEREDAGTPEPAPAPRRDESPFDYEASEQISEDLSVSFPVDI